MPPTVEPPRPLPFGSAVVRSRRSALALPVQWSECQGDQTPEACVTWREQMQPAARQRSRREDTMKRALKWSGISVAIGAAACLAYWVASVVRVEMDRGLAQAERVTSETRQALERTQEALAHTEN